MKRNIFLLAVCALAAGCASKGEMNLMQRDIDDLRTSLTQLEKTLAVVKTETKEVSEKTSTEVTKNLENLRRGTADMQANLDTMRIDIQVMSGKVEELGVAAKKPFEDIALFREDATRKLTAMEDRLKKLEANAEQVEKKLAAVAKSIEAPPTAEASYKQAQDALNAGDTAKARLLFTRFNETFPGHRLAPNVQYWIGESWYIDKNFEQAVLEFQKVIKDFPGKDKVPAAMLKQAMAFRELGDGKSARFVLKELLEKYPAADEAVAAKDLLAKLK